MNPICISDFAQAAQKKLPEEIFNFFNGGANNEFTLKRNEEKFKEIFLLPRVLRHSSKINTHINLLNSDLDYPFIAAPMAFQSLAHPSGELSTIKAISNKHLGMIVSTMSSTPLEEISLYAQNALLWFQLYIYKNPDFTRELINRATASNYKGIVITVDAPIMGRRYKDLKSKFKLPNNCIAANLPSHLKDELYKRNNEGTIKHFTDTHFKNDLCWEDIEWVKAITNLPIILKGIMHPLDAIKAIEHGVDAIIVSNHGGRQLDTSPSTIEILSLITQKVEQKIPVLIDGGIRNGTDIFKALALGANSICIGRPLLWGLTVNGQQGITDVLNCYLTEFTEAMILCGCSSIEDIRKQGPELIIKNYPEYFIEKAFRTSSVLNKFNGILP